MDEWIKLKQSRITGILPGIKDLGKVTMITLFEHKDTMIAQLMLCSDNSYAFAQIGKDLNDWSLITNIPNDILRQAEYFKEVDTDISF